MYNGIGLQTARGSGTNGYVQRNLSFVRKHKDRVDYKSEEELKKLDQQLIKQPNKEILDHERKRKVELKCMEMQELMEEQGYSADEIDQKVTMFRTMLMNKEGVSESSAVDKDETGRPIAKETHQIAEATAEKNARIKEAFGISEYYVDGSSFDPNRKAKEDQAKAVAMAQKKYAIVRDSSSSERSPSPPPKKKKKKSRAESRSPSRKEKKKKSKKHRHDRSDKKRSSSKRKRRRRDEKRKRSRRRRSPSSSSRHSTENSHSDTDSSSDEEKNNNQVHRSRKGTSSTSPRGQRGQGSAVPEINQTKERSRSPAVQRSPSLHPHSSSRENSPIKEQEKEELIVKSQEETLTKSSLGENPAEFDSEKVSPKIKPATQISLSSDVRNKPVLTPEKQRSPVVKKSRSKSNSRSRSRSRSYSRSRSHKRHSYSRSKSRSRSRSKSKKRSYSRSWSRSRSRSRNRESRSPSIRRRKGSPSHLDRRRITSARKRPVPYYRPTPPSPSSDSSYDSDYPRSRSRSRQRYRSRSASFHSRRNRRSFSDTLRN